MVARARQRRREEGGGVGHDLREVAAEARPVAEVIEAEDVGREGELVGEGGHVEGGGAEEGPELDNGEGADRFDEVSKDGVGGAPATKAAGGGVKKQSLLSVGTDFLDLWGTEEEGWEPSSSSSSLDSAALRLWMFLFLMGFQKKLQTSPESVMDEGFVEDSQGRRCFEEGGEGLRERGEGGRRSCGHG